MELDLEFTADGVPILMHDDTVDRTTNGSGPLSKLLFSELRKLDAATKHRLRLDLFHRHSINKQDQVKNSRWSVFVCEQ